MVSRWLARPNHSQLSRSHDLKQKGLRWLARWLDLTTHHSPPHHLLFVSRHDHHFRHSSRHSSRPPFPVVDHVTLPVRLSRPQTEGSQVVSSVVRSNHSPLTPSPPFPFFPSRSPSPPPSRPSTTPFTSSHTPVNHPAHVRRTRLPHTASAHRPLHVPNPQQQPQPHPPQPVSNPLNGREAPSKRAARSAGGERSVCVCVCL